MWALPTDDEILSQINHENMITLKMIKKTDRQNFKLYNCNLLLAENLKSCYRILRSCHDLKKVELQYCQIDDRTMGILLKALAKLPDLLYLGGWTPTSLPRDFPLTTVKDSSVSSKLFSSGTRFILIFYKFILTRA